MNVIGMLGKDELAGLVDLVPDQADALSRLVVLTDADRPVVAVLGRYNHGKSTLLNALIGKEHFATSDIRETRVASSHVCDGIEWLDTPGLDADVAGNDDRLAMTAARDKADVRLLVHALDQGELDESELAMAQDVLHDAQATGRSTLLVLTRVLSVEAADQATVLERIQQQLPQAQIVPVTALCHLTALEQHSEVLRRSGNIDALRVAINGLLKGLHARRVQERALLIQRVSRAVQHRLAHRREQYRAMKTAWQREQDSVVGSFRRLQRDIAREL